MMNKIIFTLLIVISGLVISSAQYNLNLNIQNLSSTTGRVLVAIYKASDDFMATDKCFIRKALPINMVSNDYLIENVPAGEYAVVVLHDMNNNNKMDLNFLGIPKEGYGFSNNPSSKMRQPNYEESKFTMKGDQEVMIKMVNW